MGVLIAVRAPQNRHRVIDVVDLGQQVQITIEDLPSENPERVVNR